MAAKKVMSGNRKKRSVGKLTGQPQIAPHMSGVPGFSPPKSGAVKMVPHTSGVPGFSPPTSGAVRIGGINSAPSFRGGEASPLLPFADKRSVKRVSARKATPARKRGKTRTLRRY